MLVNLAIFQAKDLAADPAGLRKRVGGHNDSPPEVHNKPVTGECVLRDFECSNWKPSCRYGRVPKVGVSDPRVVIVNIDILRWTW
jgi:hypothetical protein